MGTPRPPTNQPGSPGARTTVVVPVWDDYVSERLEQALQSVRAQQTPPPPVVVVDNASAVTRPTLPGAWVLRAPKRLTLGAARNLGLTRVETPYVIFWDADDVMLDGTLSFLEAAISAGPAVVAFGTAVLDEASGRRHRWPRRRIKRLVRSPHRFAFLNAIWSLYPSTGSTIMRTDAVRAAGGYSDADSGLVPGRIPRLPRPFRLERTARSPLPRPPWIDHGEAHVPARSDPPRRRGPPRIRTDPGIPEWARRSLPLLGRPACGDRSPCGTGPPAKKHQLSGSA